MKVRFPDDLHKVARAHERRRTRKRLCATWPRYNPPDPDDPEHKKYVLFREWVARKRAWTIACEAKGRWEKFQDMDEKFFTIKDPILPKILYASDRTFVLDSGASYHLIGLNKLTEKEKATIRPVDEPFRIQSANGAITVEEEAQIYVPALDIWIWAQLLEDCPAVLSLGILCSKQGWNYEWKMEVIPQCRKDRRVLR